MHRVNEIIFEFYNENKRNQSSHINALKLRRLTLTI